MSSETTKKYHTSGRGEAVRPKTHHLKTVTRSLKVIDNKTHRFLNTNGCLPRPLLGHSPNVSGVSLATMHPTAGRKPVKCQPGPECCSYCVLPGSLAFHVHPDYSCRPREDSSKIIVFHTMVPVMGTSQLPFHPLSRVRNSS